MTGDDAPPSRAASRWSSPQAIVSYVVLAALVVVASFWSARTGRADVPNDPTPTGSPTASSAGTPRITITLTPSWESPTASVVTPQSTLGAGPVGLKQPYVLAGSAAGGYARLDVAHGSWAWRRMTRGQPFLGWAGATALFGGLDRASGRPVVFGVTSAGVRTFVSHAGTYVTSTPSRILLADGRRLTALTASGTVAWRATLPTGVTRPGHIAWISGPGGVPAAPSVISFSSRNGPGRVTTVGLIDGELRTRIVPAPEPSTWATAWGLMVGDASRATVVRYDTTGTRAWTRDGLSLLDVQGSVALVKDAATRTVALLRLQDGSTIWTSDPYRDPVVSGSITTTDSGPLLVEVGYADVVPPVVVSVDPINGDQLWAVAQRVILGTWRGYVLLADPSRNELSARDLRTGNPSATLNTNTVLTPAGTVVLDGLLVYLDSRAGTAHAVAMADH